VNTNTADRELLELAAKAAGINGVFTLGSGSALEMHTPRGFQIYWNPIADDADALRLAAKLGVDVCFGANYVTARGSVQTLIVSNADSIYAATRRAIVRAAAEIGRQMP